ncbi:MAG: OmpA family protein [Rikenellaceae bacterium]
MRRLIHILLPLLLVSIDLSAQNQRLSVDIYYELYESVVDPNIEVVSVGRNGDSSSKDQKIINRESFAEFEKILHEIQSNPESKISRIEIDSYTSPEGGRKLNERVAAERSASISAYLQER